MIGINVNLTVLSINLSTLTPFVHPALQVIPRINNKSRVSTLPNLADDTSSRRIMQAEIGLDSSVG